MEISVGHVPELDLGERAVLCSTYCSPMFDIWLSNIWLLSRTWDCLLSTYICGFSISSNKNTTLPVGASLASWWTKKQTTTQHNSFCLHHTRQYIFIEFHKMVNPHGNNPYGSPENSRNSSGHVAKRLRLQTVPRCSSLEESSSESERKLIVIHWQLYIAAIIVIHVHDYYEHTFLNFTF